MERVAHAAHPRAARGPGARRGALRNLHPRRRRAALGALAALLLGAALAAPAWAQDIVHPRVLMDTQITVGGYRQDNSTDVDHWGYADGPAIDADKVAVTVHDGSLGDATFVYQGVEYTVKRLTISSNTGSLEIEIEDADAAALPDTAAVGIELQGSPTGETVLFDWRQRARSDVESEVETLLTAWRDAPGTVLPVRILNLDASDVWSADLNYGTKTSLTVGYGAPATGSLTATGFALDGVEYTVDRLTVTTTTTGEDFVRFATTPDLPATARLRLAVPWALHNPGLNRYLALEPASRVSGGTDVDYEWPWSGSIAGHLRDETAPVYLTRAPGRTGDVSGFWEATLTPNDRQPHPPDLVGYRGAGLNIPGFPYEPAGAGTLAPGTMSLGGVTYTVDVLAIVSDAVDYLNLSLRTDPLLPRGQDLWLELEHVDGSTAVFAIDTATVEAPGYLWRDAYAGEDRHGWGTDSADADTDIDSVTVRLSTGAPTITGTAQVGQTLTAVTTGITDADGLTSATYTYQWIQVNGTAADIAGENSSTYTLVDADLGKAIKVKVSFTDDASNAETRTSAATATVTAAPTTVPAVLVSNVAKAASDAEGLASTDLAQPFTTGDNADGYTLTSIELTLGTSSDTSSTTAPTVKLFRGSANGTEVATLNGPANLARSVNVNYEFTPSSTVNLFGSTTYWVVAEGAVSWISTRETTEDATPAPGWSIGNNKESRSASSTGGFTAETRNVPAKIRVNGTVGATPNTAPTVANEILDQTATVGTVFIFELPDDTFTDADSDTLTYTATQSDDTALPSWLTFDAVGPSFSGLPLAADVETLSVKVTASDGTESVSDIFDIVVSAGTTTATCTGMCLVSNVGQTAVTDIEGLASNDLAQSFTTGTNATGYTLTSIELRLSAFGNLTTPTVKLYSGSANGTEESTFTGPATLGTGLANYTFTPSSTVNLLTSTTYWVVAEGSVSWANVVSTSEDAQLPTVANSEPQVQSVVSRQRPVELPL